MDYDALELGLSYMPPSSVGKLQFTTNDGRLRRLVQKLAAAKRKAKGGYAETVVLEMLRPVGLNGGGVEFSLGLESKDFDEARQLAEELFGQYGLGVAEVKLSWIRGGTSGVTIEGHFILS